ncbi:MAG: chemotaxis protein CheW [Clostridium sp.]
MQMVVFKLGNEHFAVETGRVQTIKEIMAITKVPKAPSYIKGLINLRGSIISLVDLNMLLNVDEKENHKNIIVLTVNGEEIGITVDKVDEVIDINEELVQSVDEASRQEYVKGIVNHGNKLLTIIDIDKLVYRF